MSPFMFTQTLLSLLRRTAALPGSDVRIITTASNAHADIKPSHLPNGFKNTTDLNGPGTPGDDSFNAQRRRYGLSKLANILYTKELGKRLGAEAPTFVASSHDEHEQSQMGGRILTMCVHPGPVATEGNFRSASSLPWPLTSLALLLMRMLFRTPTQGAQCVVDAATASLFRESFAEFQGQYLEPVKGGVSVKLGDLTELAKDEELARELWELTERILEENGIGL